MTEPDWCDRLIEAVQNRGSVSALRMFQNVDPPGLPRDEFIRQIAERLRHRPDLVEAWQTYSYDKRSSPGPYLDALEVGFFDSERRDVHRYDAAADACADFLYREVQSVLR